jgi:DHA2 family multidrug resistance protein
MRNIGGSIGIAVTGTMLSRSRQAFGSLLGEHVTIFDSTTSLVLAQLKATFLSRSGDPVSATNQAYVVLHRMVQRQAAMVSFVMIFRVIGILFFVMIPLVLLMRRPTGPRTMVAAE